MKTKTSSLRSKLTKGFTVLEYVLVFGLIALGAKLVYPSLTGIVSDSKATTEKSQAQFLASKVAEYRVITGLNITGTAADPMTLTRANAIMVIVRGPLTDVASGGSKTLVEAGFQFPANTTFPSGWGEPSVGVFDNIP